MFKCPGLDQRFWKPDDIFEVACPGCGYSLEFFRDEPRLKCRKCGQSVINPFDLETLPPGFYRLVESPTGNQTLQS